MNFTVVGKREDLVIHAVGDASYKCDAPSVGGNVMMLGNRNTNTVSPIYWKSKQIPKVCHSAKDAETRNIMTNVDTAVYLSQQLSILLFGKSEVRIPVKVYTDSLPLLESIASSRQVVQRLLRNTMNDLKQKLIDGDVQAYSWIDTKSMIADILTKEGGEIETILEVIRENTFKKSENLGFFFNEHLLFEK